MNINTLRTTVTWMPTVQTPKDHSIAHVIRDIREMVSRVLVLLLLFLSSLRRPLNLTLRERTNMPKALRDAKSFLQK